MSQTQAFDRKFIPHAQRKSINSLESSHDPSELLKMQKYINSKLNSKHSNTQQVPEWLQRWKQVQFAEKRPDLFKKTPVNPENQPTPVEQKKHKAEVPG